MGRYARPKPRRFSPARRRRRSCCGPQPTRRPRATWPRRPTSTRPPLIAASSWRCSRDGRSGGHSSGRGQPECGMGSAECGVAVEGRPADSTLVDQLRIPHSAFRTISTGGPMKLYDLSQPLNERSSFWPYYPPFEVKYIKRKAEHGVNAQYIMTSNHMGTHLDAPRHFVTAGKTIDELPLEWLCGPGVIVDLRDEMDELAVYTPQMIEKRVQVKVGDLLLLHTGWHRYADFGATPDEERYYHYPPGAHPDLVPWLLEKKIHVWGVDCVSTDHPMNLPIGRFLGKGAHGQCDKVRAKAEQKFGGKAAVEKMFPDSAYQLTHNALFPKDCIHIENLGGEIDAPELQNKRLIVGCFPWKFKGGEAAFCRTVAFTGEWGKWA